jgi:hypothetical protein
MQKDTLITIDKNKLKDYSEHYQNAKTYLNASYRLSITSGNGDEALRLATLATNEAIKFMQALRIVLGK